MQKRKLNILLGLIGLIFFIYLLPVGAKSTAFVETSKRNCGQDILHEYRHKDTGLRLVWVENDDPNMSFTLGVKTPTTDNTGVNHIIEHTLFTGSKSYPSSTLFFDASSKYPNLFMNAMTSSDMTMFPFATSHKACFKTLMSIYLDSILNPKMLENPYSFYEESFHYNPTTNQYGGVVYNEMKGASTDSGRQIFRAIRQSLYEGTHYEHDSGGDPAFIPELTYENFVETYKNFYYPGNMMIVLYGDLNIGEVLEEIDESFKFFVLTDKVIDVNVMPTLDVPKKICYFNSQGSSGYLIKSFVIERDLTSKEMLEMDLWVSSYLVDEQSYFMKTMKARGVPKVQIVKDNDLKYPSYSIVMLDIPQAHMEEYEQILEETLERVCKAPKNLEIEKDIIAKNKLIACREDESTIRGIEISQTFLDAWAHDKSSDYYFTDRAYINEIETISDSYKTEILESPTMTIYLLPKSIDVAGLKTPSQEEKEDWQELIGKIGTWQQETKHLPLPDISLKSLMVEEVLPYKIYEKEHIKYIVTESNGALKRTTLYLPTDSVPQEELPALFLYSEFLGKAASERTPFEEVLDIDVMAVEREKLCPYLKISVISNQDQDIMKTFNEVNEALLEKDAVWYEAQLQSFMNRFKEQFSSDVLGTLKWLNTSAQSGYKRYLFETHYPLYTYCAYMKNSHSTAYIEAIKEIAGKTKPVEGSVIGIQGDKSFNQEQLKKYENYFKANPVEKNVEMEYSFIKSANLNIYYKNTPVDYLLFSYDKGQDQLDGKDYVMASYITNQYLRPHIRLEQGAYGSTMIASYPNNLILYTYRDPDILASIKHITVLSSVLREELDEEALNIARIDALSQVQNQLNFIGNPLEKGIQIEKMILLGIKPEKLLKLQKEIVKCNLKDLDEKLSLLPYLFDSGQMSVCTGRSHIKSTKEANIYRVK